MPNFSKQETQKFHNAEILEALQYAHYVNKLQELMGIDEITPSYADAFAEYDMRLEAAKEHGFAAPTLFAATKAMRNGHKQAQEEYKCRSRIRDNEWATTREYYRAKDAGQSR